MKRCRRKPKRIFQRRQIPTPNRDYTNKRTRRQDDHYNRWRICVGVCDFSLSPFPLSLSFTLALLLVFGLLSSLSPFRFGYFIPRLTLIGRTLSPVHFDYRTPRGVQLRRGDETNGKLNADSTMKRTEWSVETRNSQRRNSNIRVYQHRQTKSRVIGIGLLQKSWCFSLLVQLMSVGR